MGYRTVLSLRAREHRDRRFSRYSDPLAAAERASPRWMFRAVSVDIRAKWFCPSTGVWSLPAMEWVGVWEHSQPAASGLVAQEALKRVVTVEVPRAVREPAPEQHGRRAAKT